MSLKKVVRRLAATRAVTGIELGGWNNQGTTVAEITNTVEKVVDFARRNGHRDSNGLERPGMSQIGRIAAIHWEDSEDPDRVDVYVRVGSVKAS